MWPPIWDRLTSAANVSGVHFIKLELHDAAGKLLSSNFYWRGRVDNPDDLTALNQLPLVTLTAKAERQDNASRGHHTAAIRRRTSP